MNKAVFIDRDGTINVEKNYLYKIKDFEFIEGAQEAIKLLNNTGYKVIVITNQSGVARGYYTEDDVKKLHLYINQELKQIGAHIDAFYYCPHHFTEGLGYYKVKCNCRKPNNGLFLKAINKFHINIRKSFAIGDKLTDLIPAKNMKIQTILLSTGYGDVEHNKENFNSIVDYYEMNLLKSINNIIIKDNGEK